MSGSSLKRVWKVPGRCLEGPHWTGLAQFGSGRYWVVSECCLDIMEGVWKEYQMCLESTCKVSGSCNGDKVKQIKQSYGVFWRLEGGWKVCCKPLLVGVWRCVKGVWKVSETCQKVVWKPSSARGTRSPPAAPQNLKLIQGGGF